MQPRRLLPVIVCLGLLGGLVAWMAFRPKRATPAAPIVPTLSEADAPVASKSPLPAPVPATPAPTVAEATEKRTADASTPDPVPASAGVEEAVRRIEAAVVTYEAASLPVIAPYLTHADPELRLAAREGLLQMGLFEAVPLLREAAGKIKDPREAILLLDAADFLELPSVSSTAGKKRHAHPVTSSAPPTEGAGRR